ncbi:MAG: sialate O-acetylesterase, partial [Bacteroidales bacterium]|nr:sialate O-acetylesterase [Bacteroidales bacterium]
MPFYFVQIAPYGKSKSEDDPRGNMFWAQAQTLEMIPNSGMVCIFDAGEPTCIHPANKKIVGDRLAFQVLEFEYGISVIDSRTPMPIKFEFNDGEAVVTFDFVSRRGIGPINQDLEGFELAGEDRIFYPAKGQVISKVHRNQVRVYGCPEVTKPVAVRYGIKDGAPATLFNCYGIPVTPFRSDDW